MRKSVMGILMLAAMVAGTSVAKAQTQISFQNSNSGVTFLSNGTLTNASSTATVQFNNVTGTALTSSPLASYSYTFSDTNPVTLTEIGTGVYSAANTPLTTLSIGSGLNELSGNLIYLK